MHGFCDGPAIVRALHSRHTNRIPASNEESGQRRANEHSEDRYAAGDGDDQEGARFTALEQIKARAKRDAGEALQSLRDELTHYRSLEEGCDEALDIACGFALRFSDDCGSMIGIEVTTGCELWLDYDCDADIGQSGIT